MKKKIKGDISDKELKKLSFSQVVAGRPIIETLEVFLMLGAIIYGIYIGIKIFKDNLYNLYWIINYLITSIFTIYVFFKFTKTVFGQLFLRINLFFWFSLIFIFHIELSPLHFYYMAPVAFILVFMISYELDNRFVKKNKINPSLIGDKVLAKNQGFYIYLISYLLFLTIVYFIFTKFLN